VTAQFDPERWERAQRRADLTLRGLPPEDDPPARTNGDTHAAEDALFDDVDHGNPPNDGVPSSDKMPEQANETKGKTDSTPTLIVPTPYICRDPSEIEPRQWLYGRHYIRKYVTATIGAPGMGKTSLSLVEAIAMASGKDLLGATVREPLRVWGWNGEDPRDEIERRVAAILLHYNLSSDDLGGRLCFDSGRDLPINLATAGPRGVVLDEGAVDRLVAAVQTFGADVVIFDPFVSCHRTDENSNAAIDLIIKQGMGVIAERGNAAVELAHHIRKGQFGQEARTVDDARGASAIIGAVRSARVLNKMTEKEAQELGIASDQRGFFFRVDLGKSNMQPPPTAGTWRRLVSEPLGNARPDWPQDFVQVATAWTPPAETNAAEMEVDALFLKLLDTLMAQGRYVTDKESRLGAAQLFAANAAANGTTKAAFKRAMERLFHREEIEIEIFSEDSKKRSGLSTSAGRKLPKRRNRNQPRSNHVGAENYRAPSNRSNCARASSSNNPPAGGAASPPRMGSRAARSSFSRVVNRAPSINANCSGASFIGRSARIVRGKGSGGSPLGLNRFRRASRL
jgi:hypothetical protein